MRSGYPILIVSATALFALSLVGCEGPARTTGDKKADASAGVPANAPPPPAPLPPAAKNAESPDSKSAAHAATTEAEATASESSQPNAPSAPEPGVQREAAAVGVGAKGHYGQGVIATPLGEYWRGRERIAFQIQIPHAMQLFKGLEGRAPATQEEFFAKIIKENAIQLPELPPQHRYVYDPATEQLYVEHPE